LSRGGARATPPRPPRLEALAPRRKSPLREESQRKGGEGQGLDEAAAHPIGGELAGVAQLGLARAGIVGEEREGHVVPRVRRPVDEVVQPREELAAVVTG